MTWIRNRPLGLVYLDPEQAAGGYTLFCSVRGHHATLIDDQGQIVHRWHHPSGIQHAELLANGNLLIHSAPAADAGGAEQIGGSAEWLLELDSESKVVWSYREPLMHHAYRRLPDGNTLIIAWRQMPREVCDRIQGGHSHPDDPAQMWGDVVQKISPAGELADEWLSWEHLSFDDDQLCPLESRKEWTHANSIDLTPDGDWLLSFRLTSKVAIVDAQTGAFKWKWGRVLSHQHAATWLPSGRVLIFDNGCHRRRMPTFSQILEVDPETDEIEWQYQGRPLLSFFSFMISGANRLANGNTLITEGATGRLFEITQKGETVWEYVSPFQGADPRFGPTPAVFRAHRHAAHDPELANLSLDPERWRRLTERVRQGELGVEEA